MYWLLVIVIFQTVKIQELSINPKRSKHSWFRNFNEILLCKSNSQWNFRRSLGVKVPPICYRIYLTRKQFYVNNESNTIGSASGNRHAFRILFRQRSTKWLRSHGNKSNCKISRGNYKAATSLWILITEQWAISEEVRFQYIVKPNQPINSLNTISFQLQVTLHKTDNNSEKTWCRSIESPFRCVQRWMANGATRFNNKSKNADQSDADGESAEATIEKKQHNQYS